MTEVGSYCTHCGAKIEPTSKFCSNCGKPISLAAAAAPPPATVGSSDRPQNKKTSKKTIAGVAVLVILGFFGILIAIGLSVGSTNPNTNTTATPALNQTQQTEDRIAALLGNDPERMNDPAWRQVATDIIRTENMDNALLVIHSTTSWSAVIQDSNFVQESVDGSGSTAIEFECSTSGIYSISVQKQSEGGVLNVAVAQDGQILKQANTGAAYGVVSVAGTCA